MGKGTDRKSKYFCRRALNMSEAQFLIVKYLVDNDLDQVGLMAIGEFVAENFKPVSKQYVSQEIKKLVELGLVESVRQDQVWVSLIPGVKKEFRVVFGLLEVIKGKRDAWRKR